jgi:hypothetical protein
MMNRQVTDKLLKAVDRSKKLRSLNMFLKETFEDAIGQATRMDGMFAIRFLLANIFVKLI